VARWCAAQRVEAFRDARLLSGRTNPWIARYHQRRLPSRSRCPGRRGRSTEVFRDGDLEIRFAAKPTNGPQVPHQRDEFYVVAAGTAQYRVEDRVTAVGPGDLLSLPRMWRTGSRISRRIFVSG